MPTTQSIPSPTPDPISVAGFEAFLEKVKVAPTEDRNWMVGQYFVNEPPSPLMSDTAAIFIYQGSGGSVRITGDLNNWDADGKLYMQRVSGTNLWWHRGDYEPAARLDYTYVIDDVERPDPRNPLTINTGFGVRSVLQMPGYIPPRSYETAVARGTLTPHQISSENLGQARTFFVYEPPTKIVGQSLPSVYVHDGGDYLSLAGMQAQLDVLISERAIPPLVAIFVPPIDRQVEYHSPAYRAFIAQELVPFVQEKYDVDVSAAKTGTMGASLGGLVSLRLGMEYPKVFNLIGSHSGAFSLSQDRTPTMFANLTKQPLKLHLIIGTYETAIRLPAPEGDLLASNRQIAAVLEEKGYAYTYVEYPEGHSWGLWSAHIADTLSYLYNDHNG